MSNEVLCTGEKNGYCFACLARSNGNCVEGKSAEVFIPEPDVPCRHNSGSGYCLSPDVDGYCIHQLPIEGGNTACERDL